MREQQHKGYLIRKISNWETVVYRTYYWHVTNSWMRGDMVAVCRSVPEARKRIDDATIEVVD